MKYSGQPVSHESAAAHVTGAALYTDDLAAQFPGLLHAWPVLAPHAHALLLRLDAAEALKEPGVVTTLTADDVPGEGDSGANRRDEPLFPIEVTCHSQPVAWVLGETQEAARRGAARVEAEYRPLTPVLTIEDAARGRGRGVAGESAPAHRRAVYRRSGTLLPRDHVRDCAAR
jgi:xanthine dehydrogenase large subunit